MPTGRETMRMTAERIAANRRPVGPVVRLAIAYRIPPAAMARISLGFAVIAAVWLALGSAGDDGVALVAAIAVFVAVDAGRVLGQDSDAPVVEWGLTACALLAELFVYAGMAAGVSLRLVSVAPSGPAGQALRGTFVAGLGGAGATGVWRLAVIAVMLAVLVPMVNICLRGPAATASGPRVFGPLGDVRLPVAVAVVLLAGVGPGSVGILDWLLAAPVIGPLSAQVMWRWTPWIARARRAWLSRREGRPPYPGEHIGLQVWGQKGDRAEPLWRAFLTEQ